ncbi:MAG: helix-turn-helix domain-containing protein [Bacteroidota bacterium]
MKIKGFYTTVFPRSGDLILNLYTGGSFGNRISNYATPWATLNKLYLSGLFSREGLHLQQYGACDAYAIKIHPVIGYYLLGIPMHELVDKQVQISNVLESKGMGLRRIEKSEKLRSIGNKHLTKFLISILPEKSVYSNDPIYHIVNFIKDRHGLVAIRELASLYCMSERTMNRQFLLKVGLSAQAYAKIWQVEYAMLLIQQNPMKSLDEIAFISGYYDTAHLSRDFRRKVDLSPSSFRSQTSKLTLNYLDTKRFF